MRPGAAAKTAWGLAAAVTVLMCAEAPALSAATGWEPAARVGVAFGRNVQPTPDTLKGLEIAMGLYRSPDCYWVADARAKAPDGLDNAQSRADALRVALIERDLPPDRVVAWAHVDPKGPIAATELHIHCSPPGTLSLPFNKASADLTRDAELWLDVLAASVPARDRAFVIRGYAAPAEQTDPLKLALARALILRHALIERGFSGRLIQVEAEEKTAARQDLPADTEIVLH